MSTIMKEVEILNTGHVLIELDLPAGFPIGKAVMTLKSRDAENTDGKHVNRAAEVCGMGKGKVWVADDFDAPLEDFAEYM